MESREPAEATGTRDPEVRLPGEKIPPRAERTNREGWAGYVEVLVPETSMDPEELLESVREVEGE